MEFVKATKSQAKARYAFVGVPGSGKTWTGLTFARELAGPNGKVAVIDTENRSASKYADLFDFDTLNLDSFTPRSYIEAIRVAEEMKYDALFIDSLSHGWIGKDGVLAMVDNATSRGKSGNAFTSGWREVTPEHNALVDALVRCKCHLGVTMRSKVEYVIEEGANGKKMPRKVGMAPVQREGLEYEFDLVADFDSENTMVVTKSRCSKLSGGVYRKPSSDVAAIFKQWLTDGTPPPPPASEQDVILFRELREQVEMPVGWDAMILKKAGVDRWEDMPADKLAGCLKVVQQHQNNGKVAV
jgi:DNA polymerase III delta prime subunit